MQRKDLPKNPKYIDTRMDELFPARKSSIRLRLLSKKENSKVVTLYWMLISRIPYAVMLSNPLFA